MTETSAIAEAAVPLYEPDRRWYPGMPSKRDLGRKSASLNRASVYVKFLPNRMPPRVSPGGSAVPGLRRQSRPGSQAIGPSPSGTPECCSGITGSLTQSMPGWMQNASSDCRVDCLSPAGNDDTVNPAASLPLSSSCGCQPAGPVHQGFVAGGYAAQVGR